MRPSVLLDTGAILALLNHQDRFHSACIQAVSQLPTPFLTSEAVLTETLYMVAAHGYNVDHAWGLIRSGMVTLGGVGDSDLPVLERLMRQYRDRPMDFADATLVHLAQRESLTTILTVDVADFQIYRIDGRKRFRVLPATALA